MNTTPSTGRKIFYWLAIASFVLPIAEFVLVLLQAYTSSPQSYGFMPPIPPTLDLLLLLFFVFSPVFFLVAGLLSFWLRKTEEEGRKKVLTLVMYLSLFSFFLSVWYLYSAFRPLGGVPAPTINPLSCHNSARMAIQAKGLQDIHSCSVEGFDVNGDNIDYVSISYGQGHDCPSGCFYDSYQALVDNKGKVYDFYFLPHPFYALVNKYGVVCSSFDYEKNDLPRYQRKIIRDGESFRWQLVFQNFDAKQTRRDSGYYADYQCILNGTLTFLSSSSEFVDDSQLSVKPLLPDCLTLTDNKKREICLLDEARIKQDVSSCINHVSGDTCYLAVALSTLNENLCKNISDDYRRGRCYLGIAQEKRDVKICRNIPRDFERGQCVESVEKFLGIFEQNYDRKKNDELYNQALQESKYIFCSQIRYNESLKTQCYKNVAVQLKDEIVCRQILDEYSGPECIRDVRKAKLTEI